MGRRCPARSSRGSTRSPGATEENPTQAPTHVVAHGTRGPTHVHTPIPTHTARRAAWPPAEMSPTGPRSAEYSRNCRQNTLHRDSECLSACGPLVALPSRRVYSSSSLGGAPGAVTKASRSTAAIHKPEFSAAPRPLGRGVGNQICCAASGESSQPRTGNWAYELTPHARHSPSGRIGVLPYVC